LKIGFFTAETQKTQRANYFFLFADPGGIGSAFHRAEEGEKEKSACFSGL